MIGQTVVFERRMEELFFILNRKETTIPELANYFSVSQRTVYRDILFLSRYAPIYTKAGLYGGVFIADGYVNPITNYLTENEKNRLNKISETLTDSDARFIKKLIYKFTMPTYQGT